MNKTTFILIAAALTSGAARADEHRELGPHVHGHGNFNMAVEDTKVQISLEVPGMDIVGFEHAASTDEQKAIVDKATKTLSEPLSLFKVPAAAGCSVADAKVAIEPEHHHDGDDDDDDHDHDAKTPAAGGEKAAGDHDHDEHGHEGHNEFHVTYALTCTKPASLTSIAFDYFKSFAGAHDLTVNVVTTKAQNTYQVSRDKPSLDLGGMM